MLLFEVRFCRTMIPAQCFDLRVKKIALKEKEFRHKTAKSRANIITTSQIQRRNQHTSTSNDQVRSRFSHDYRNLLWSVEELFTVCEKSSASALCRRVNIASESVDLQVSLLGSFPNAKSTRREWGRFLRPLVRGSGRQVACATP